MNALLRFTQGHFSINAINQMVAEGGKIATVLVFFLFATNFLETIFIVTVLKFLPDIWRDVTAEWIIIRANQIDVQNLVSQLELDEFVVNRILEEKCHEDAKYRDSKTESFLVFQCFCIWCASYLTEQDNIWRVAAKASISSNIWPLLKCWLAMFFSFALLHQRFLKPLSIKMIHA